VLLSVRRFAAECGLGVRTIRRAIAAGALPPVTFRSRRLVPPPGAP